MKLIILNVFLIILIIINYAYAERCGPDYGNKKCTNNECCSKWGYCGTSEKHCSSGCQSKYGRCGSLKKTTTKAKTTSKGKTTSKYITKSTKKTTKKNKTTSKKNTIIQSKTTKTTTKMTTFTFSQSTSTSKIENCGPNNGYVKCSFGDCCSKEGKCGFGYEYCYEGCQSNYGLCLGELPDPNPKLPEDPPKETHCGPKYGFKKCSFGNCCSKDGRCGFGHEYCGEGCQSEYSDLCL